MVSKAFSENKAKYYDAFKQARSPEEHGSLNDFIIRLSHLLLTTFNGKTEELKAKFADIKQSSPPEPTTKSEGKIYSLILEASALSDFGISNEEVLFDLGISKRTLLYALKTLHEKDLLIDTKIGRITYHKIKL